MPLAVVRRAAMLLSSTAVAARVAIDGGLAALEAIQLQIGTGVQPMLAASAPDPEGAVAKTGLPAVVDYKLDGVRVQVHRAGKEVVIFTRSLDDITARLPEVVDLVRSLPEDYLVLDGEVLALYPDGSPQPFQETMRRFGRRLDVERLRSALLSSVSATATTVTIVAL
jgi:DNA ligase-1